MIYMESRTLTEKWEHKLGYQRSLDQLLKYAAAMAKSLGDNPAKQHRYLDTQTHFLAAAWQMNAGDVRALLFDRLVSEYEGSER